MQNKRKATKATKATRAAQTAHPDTFTSGGGIASHEVRLPAPSIAPVHACDARAAADSIAWPAAPAPAPARRTRRRNPLASAETRAPRKGGEARRARAACEREAAADPAQDDARAWRRNRRMRGRAKRAARVLARLRALGYAAAERLRAKREGSARAFGARFVPEFAEEFASGALVAYAGGARRRDYIRAGYETGNALLRRLSHEAGGDALLSLPAEIVTPEDEAAEDSAAILSATRRAILLRAIDLRARARAVYARESAAAATRGGRAGNLARMAARRAFARDSRIIRRAALCMLARLYGRPFAFAGALGVSPAGKRGGKARGELNAWQRMLAQHSATRARLAIA